MTFARFEQLWRALVTDRIRVKRIETPWPPQGFRCVHEQHTIPPPHGAASPRTLLALAELGKGNPELYQAILQDARNQEKSQ